MGGLFARHCSTGGGLLLLLALLAAGAAAQQDVTLSTSIQGASRRRVHLLPPASALPEHGCFSLLAGPKDLDVSATLTAKQAPSTEVEVVVGDDDDDAGAASVEGLVNGVKQQLGAKLSQVREHTLLHKTTKRAWMTACMVLHAPQAGIDTSKLTEFGKSLRTSASNLLSLLGATRGAYEKTLVRCECGAALALVLHSDVRAQADATDWRACRHACVPPACTACCWTTRRKRARCWRTATRSSTRSTCCAGQSASRRRSRHRLQSRRASLVSTRLVLHCLPWLPSTHAPRGCPPPWLLGTGAGGSLAITTGSCTLTRAAGPLQLDYVLSCTEPGVTTTYTAPTYTSRYVAAASATTEVLRRAAACLQLAAPLHTQC